VTTGKTYVGVQLMRLLLSNTLGPASTSKRSEAGQASGAVPLSQRPQIGPILVLCYTNHALDSFLEGLVDAGEAEWGHGCLTSDMAAGKSRADGFNVG